MGELHEASRDGDVDKVRELIESRADVNADHDEFDGGPLHFAVMFGHENIVKLLLEAGADIKKTNEDHYTPLQIANRRGYPDIASLLVEYMPDNASKLYEACKDGDVDNIKQYINDKEALKRVLCRLVDFQELDCLKQLAHFNVDFNIDYDDDFSVSETLLMTAIRLGNIDIVNFLLEHGADPELPNTLDEKPLMFAILCKSIEAIDALLDHGANINDYDECDTPLILAVRQGEGEIIKRFLDRGADVNQASDYGNNPLKTAVNSGDLSVVKLLLEHGADINIKSGDYSLSMWAYSRRHYDIVEFLDSYEMPSAD